MKNKVFIHSAVVLMILMSVINKMLKIDPKACSPYLEMINLEKNR